MGLHIAESEGYQRLPAALTALRPSRISVGADCVVLGWGGSASYGLFYAPPSDQGAVVARFSDSGVESLGHGVFLFGY